MARILPSVGGLLRSGPRHRHGSIASHPPEPYSNGAGCFSSGHPFPFYLLLYSELRKRLDTVGLVLLPHSKCAVCQFPHLLYLPAFGAYHSRLTHYRHTRAVRRCMLVFYALDSAAD